MPPVVGGASSADVLVVAVGRNRGQHHDIRLPGRRACGGALPVSGQRILLGEPVEAPLDVQAFGALMADLLAQAADVLGVVAQKPVVAGLSVEDLLDADEEPVDVVAQVGAVAGSGPAPTLSRSFHALSRNHDYGPRFVAYGCTREASRRS